MKLFSVSQCNITHFKTKACLNAFSVIPLFGRSTISKINRYCMIACIYLHQIVCFFSLMQFLYLKSLFLRQPPAIEAQLSPHDLCLLYLNLERWTESRTKDLQSLKSESIIACSSKMWSIYFGIISQSRLPLSSLQFRLFVKFGGKWSIICISLSSVTEVQHV